MARRYDWNTLIDGGSHTLRPGEDFDATPQGFIKKLRWEAKRRGGTVEITQHEDDSLTFKFNVDAQASAPAPGVETSAVNDEAQAPAPAPDQEPTSVPALD
jgi:hypothetical protein